MEPTTAADEREILFPDRTITLAGRPVTIRELRFADALAIEEDVQPLVKDLGDFLAGDEPPSLPALMRLFARHADLFLSLTARCTGLGLEEIRGLSDRDGQVLMMAFWEVNKGFFTRRAQLDSMSRILAAESGMAGGDSSRH